MCKLLKISRKMIYYNYAEKKIDADVENKIIDIFKNNRKVYGTRKIKKKLILPVSRKKIGVIMEKYGRVGNKWNYICAIIDLYNREIIGHSCGGNKSANLVIEAFNSINRPLDKVNIFHTDRGSEFKNQAIDQLIKQHNITRSLSNKGVPYDNAVAESTYNIIKTEFTFGEKFDTLSQLKLEFFDYVNWYNNIRIHGSLGYLTPCEFRKRYVLA